MVEKDQRGLGYLSKYIRLTYHEIEQSKYVWRGISLISLYYYSESALVSRLNTYKCMLNTSPVVSFLLNLMIKL